MATDGVKPKTVYENNCCGRGSWHNQWSVEQTPFEIGSSERWDSYCSSTTINKFTELKWPYCWQFSWSNGFNCFCVGIAASGCMSCVVENSRPDWRGNQSGRGQYLCILESAARDNKKYRGGNRPCYHCPHFFTKTINCHRCTRSWTTVEYFTALSPNRYQQFSLGKMVVWILLAVL